MTNKEFLSLIQKREASLSMGPSTARRMGPAGTVAKARTFLQNLDLRSIRARNQRMFRVRLDIATKKLQNALPEGGHWGSARKFLNIFLRNCLYNHYLNNHHSLREQEAWFEVPLDSHVASGLASEESGQSLPRWKTVIGLRQENSERYQDFALKVAAKEKILRVHLDVLYWRKNRVNPAVVPNPFK